MGNAERLDLGEPDMKFRDEPYVYFRTTDRHMQNELCDKSIWGDSDTYDPNREQTK